MSWHLRSKEQGLLRCRQPTVCFLVPTRARAACVRRGCLHESLSGTRRPRSSRVSPCRAPYFRGPISVQMALMCNPVVRNPATATCLQSSFGAKRCPGRTYTPSAEPSFSSCPAAATPAISRRPGMSPWRRQMQLCARKVAEVCKSECESILVLSLALPARFDSRYVTSVCFPLPTHVLFPTRDRSTYVYQLLSFLHSGAISI